MNDEGVYGYGQLAMHLRGCLALPSIRSLTKTDGLTFKVREIVDGVNARIHRNGNGATATAPEADFTRDTPPV